MPATETSSPPASASASSSASDRDSVHALALKLPKVSEINVPHLGRLREALQVDGEDVLLAATGPQGSQG